jgi:hypothetical protein
MTTDLLRTAAQVSGVWSLAAFAIAALIVYLASRKGRVPSIAWLVVAIVGLLGLVPIAGSMYVKVVTDRSMYVLRVNVTDVAGRPIDDAVVRNSLGNFADKKAGAWQFEIPKQTRPSDGRITVYASVQGAFAHGAKEVVLDSDFFPAVTVIVAADQTSTVRGAVRDSEGRAVSGVRVSVEGYGGESVTTGPSGSFELPAHAAEEQQVMLHAEHAEYEPAAQWHPAGRSPATLILKRK